MNYIITCGCGNTDDFVRDALPLLLGEVPEHSYYSGVEEIDQLMLTLPKSQFKDQLRALRYGPEKFAYYYELGEGYTIAACYDLVKGLRLC